MNPWLNESHGLILWILLLLILLILLLVLLNPLIAVVTTRLSIGVND
jgi:hypothetical protein